VRHLARVGVLSGGVIAVLSPEGGSAAELAGRMGKRKEEGKYYRKSGDRMITILVPGPSILEAAEAVSASDFFYLVVRDLTREAAELALLAEASGRPGLVLAPDPERFSSLLRGFRISGMAGEFEPREPSTPDLGFALVDSAFIVRGVGPVALGITFTPISVHDELELLPSGKRASVRSIQVLDEDQGSIGPGVRYGVSLRGVEERDLEGCYALARPGAPLARAVRVSRRFPLAPDAPSRHAVVRGIRLFGRLEDAVLSLERPAPVPGSPPEPAVLLNVNAPRGKLRVYGSGEPVPDPVGGPRGA
jgi:hypothetical protein